MYPFKKDLKKIIFFNLLVGVTGFYIKTYIKEEVITVYAEAHEPIKAVNTEKVHIPTLTPIPTPIIHLTEAEERNRIVVFIRNTFGKDSDKALLLLKGNKDCPGENPSLNSNAVYTNTKGKYIGSRDRGIFQINDYFHPTMTDEMAFNYEENIKYAYRMFKNDNYTFRRWTAGRCLGI